MKVRFLLISSLLLMYSSFLYFGQKTPPPTPAKVLSKADDFPQQTSFKPIFDTVIRHGLTDVKAVALTFDADAGFGNRKSRERREFLYQPKITEILEEEGIPATIFVTGLWAKEHPEDLRSLSRHPLFEIGNHSYSHFSFSPLCRNLSPVTKENKENEIQKAQEEIARIIDFSPRLFRFPGGCHTADDLTLTKTLGLTVVGWDTDSQDAFGKTKEAIIKNVKKEVHSGSIILFHLNGGEIDPHTIEALPEIIDYLKTEGYSFLTVGQMLSQLENATAVN